jgi:hypothetical protein
MIPGRRFAQRLFAFVFEFIDAMALIFAQREHSAVRADCSALESDRRALRLILSQRRHDVRSALEAEPLTEANHTINDGAVEQLAGFADLMPTEATQPASVVKIG